MSVHPKYGFFSPASEFILNEIQSPTPLDEITADITGPVFFSFVLWMLKDVQKRGIQRLYFLARDGFMLYTFARKICEAYHLDIDCRYLYGSRFSLRMPAYSFLSCEEIDNFLFSGGYQITPCAILGRIGASEPEKKEIYEQISFSQKDEKTILTKAQFTEFINRLKACPIFQMLIEKKSAEAFAPTIAYLKQEGLMEGIPFALVDTGWTGSIQRTIRQLLEHAGASPSIFGYYFGLYEDPRDLKDGIYSTFCFHAHSPIADIVKFNNNLLECMCIAPHPMTIGYAQKHERYEPVFKEELSAPSPLFERQFEILLLFLKRMLASTSLDALDIPKLQKESLLLLRQLMFKPTKKQALAYTDSLFCDDVSDVHRQPLVQKISEMEARQYTFFQRLLRKSRKGQQPLCELFWPYGSFAVSNLKYADWYALNVFLWDSLRCIYKYKWKQRN